MQLSEEQNILHERAIELCRQHRKLETELIRVIKAIDKTKLYKKLGQPSLFMYAVKILGLSEATAYSFISVARKSNEVAPLLAAIESQRLSVAKASRIASVLNQNNAAELIEFAGTHTTRELEFEMAKLRPQTQAPDRAKPISGDLVKLEMCVSKDVHAKLERAQALVSSKVGKNVGFEGILDAVLTEFIDRHDPVKKAERAQAKKITKSKEEMSIDAPLKRPAELCANRAAEQNSAALRPLNSRPTKRQPLTAAEKHAVFGRDGGRCTHVDSSDKRCSSDRWLQLHHLTPVSQGGRNAPENLTTLCSFHHDLVHQLSFAIEGQVTWLRDARVRYGA